MTLFMIIVCICSTIQGFLSFGGGVLLLPVLSSQFDIKLFVLPFFALYNLMTNVMNSWIYRRDIKIWDYRLLVLIGSLGSILGASYILDIVDKGVLEGLIIVVILVNLVLTGLRQFSIRDSKTSQVIVGFLSGIFSGSVGLGSFGIAIAYNAMPKNKLKALIAQFCLASNVLTAITFTVAGRFTREIVYYFLISAIPAILFQRLGNILSDRLQNDDFKKYLNIGLLIFALILVVW
ncbi:MAG: uncharacterized protein PWQ55_2740 [Chloroflexota bacterium]|nr:uncharacterized protein [Chloroflexota bacterium]